MVLCFIADFRSTIARSWIAYFAGRHQVHVLSTQPAPPMDGVELHPLASTGLDARRRAKASLSNWLDPGGWKGRLAGRARDHWLLPVEALRMAPRAARWIERIAPDLVHSLRIPNEAETGGLAGARPHVISAWGNDFTLYADHAWTHMALTRRALAGCAGFLADAAVDIERARALGLPRGVPALVVPGAGGVDGDVFFPPQTDSGAWLPELQALERIGRRPLVLNARGFRRYVRNDVFFAAVARLRQSHPTAFTVGVGLRGWRPVEDLVERLGLTENTLLTPPLPQAALAQLHGRAAVMASPTEHDGTPNTLLESMACGGLPVCGDLPSIREWIDDGVNGLLVPASDTAAMAGALARALDDGALRERARRQNPALIAQRASYGPCMTAAETFYGRVLSQQTVMVPVAGAAAREGAGS